jgi:benzylsuccinate CoA-transferase BbsF subunit
MSKQIFEGLKVADFSWVAVVPSSIRYLADHGATVIKIESRNRPDILRSFPPFKDNIQDADHNGFSPNYNCNKYGITLNMNHPGAGEVARRIISWSDIVAESYAPGIMAAWGLSYEDITRFKPDVIMVSSTMQGQTGPRKTLTGYGVHLASLAGFTALMGWPDRSPAVPYGAYTDFVVPRYIVAAIVAALLHRRRTGKGQYVDVSQHEAGLQFIAPAILDYQANGKDLTRRGNRDDTGVPHGVYPAKGNDNWIAIGIFTDSQWRALIHLMGDKELIGSERFSTCEGRKKNEDELDDRIARWTANCDNRQLMDLLQSKGIPAGAVLNAEGTHNDPQLAHRNHFWKLNHSVIGPHTYDAGGFRFSNTPALPRMPAPCVGEHNDYAYTKLLGFSDEEFATLMGKGIID